VARTAWCAATAVPAISAAVPAHQLADAVRAAGRARQHGLVGQVAPHVLRQLVRRDVAALPVLLDRLHDDPVEVAAHLARPRVVRPQARPRRVRLADVPQQLDVVASGQRLGGERQRVREQLVQDDAQRVDVGARVHVVRDEVGLLRAHVLEGADDLALLGERRARRVPLVQRARDAEVDDLRLRQAVAFGDEDVRRLEVAVDEALVVRVLHALADLEEEP
jgi:hypothetical protein